MSKLPPIEPEHDIISVSLKSMDEKNREDDLFQFPFFYNQQTMKNEDFQYIGASVVELNNISLGEKSIKLKRITQVTRKDKEKLNEDEKLNDVVINFWMNWLIMNTNDYFRHKIFYTNTYFFSKLLSDDVENVSKILSKAQVDIF